LLISSSSPYKGEEIEEGIIERAQKKIKKVSYATRSGNVVTVKKEEAG